MDRPYALSDIAVMTVITVRTLRKCVASGVLAGEKIAGKWRYTAEEVGHFLSRPEIRRLAEQRRRALADDFLDARVKSAPAMLCVLDMPAARETFLEEVLAACTGVEMAYGSDMRTGMARVTLVGAPEAVRAVIDRLEG